MRLRLMLPVRVCAAACACFVLAPAPPHPAAALKSLVVSYDHALANYRARIQASGTAARLNPASHPGRVYWPRFAALEKRNRGTQAGAEAELMVVEAAMQSGLEAPLSAALRRLSTVYSGSPVMERGASDITVDAPLLGFRRTEAFLRRLAGNTRNPEVKATALFGLAATLAQDPARAPSDARQAVYLFQVVLKRWPGTPAAARAASGLFALQRLQIGMRAPDFTARDQDGGSFKLSDYRGKVLVLEFWGFW